MEKKNIRRGTKNNIKWLWVIYWGITIIWKNEQKRKKGNYWHVYMFIRGGKRKMLTLKEVGEVLRISETTLRSWVDTGILKGYKFNREYRVSKEDLDAFIEDSKVTKF